MLTFVYLFHDWVCIYKSAQFFICKQHYMRYPPLMLSICLARLVFEKYGTTHVPNTCIFSWWRKGKNKTNKGKREGEPFFLRKKIHVTRSSNGAREAKHSDTSPWVKGKKMILTRMILGLGMMCNTFKVTI